MIAYVIANTAPYIAVPDTIISAVSMILRVILFMSLPPFLVSRPGLLPGAGPGVALKFLVLYQVHNFLIARVFRCLVIRAVFYEQNELAFATLVTSGTVLILIDPASAYMDFNAQLNQRVIHVYDIITMSEIKPEPMRFRMLLLLCMSRKSD